VDRRVQGQTGVGGGVKAGGRRRKKGAREEEGVGTAAGKKKTADAGRKRNRFRITAVIKDYPRSRMDGTVSQRIDSEALRKSGYWSILLKSTSWSQVLVGLSMERALHRPSQNLAGPHLLIVGKQSIRKISSGKTICGKPSGLRCGCLRGKGDQEVQRPGRRKGT